MLALLFLAGRASLAQAPVVGPSRFEVAASASAVSNGYGDWAALSMRAALAVGARTVFLPEVTTSQEFHDKGTLFGIGVTQTLSEPWYAFAAVTGGTGAFYLPNVRVTALL
ncbi:MAG: YaiO family outer membrane beta-barrel protein, partial [Gemmatimonadaceae bacterium]